jgi:hypothetical protein
VQAPSQISGYPPILNLRTTMTTKTAEPATVTDIEDASTARWLAHRLERARAEVQRGPTEVAVGRIRERVFGAESRHRKEPRIAA